MKKEAAYNIYQRTTSAISLLSLFLQITLPLTYAFPARAQEAIVEPTLVPTPEPTTVEQPTLAPEPTLEPTIEPTAVPIIEVSPTVAIEASPTAEILPTLTQTPVVITETPTITGTPVITETPAVTTEPTIQPTSSESSSNTSPTATETPAMSLVTPTSEPTVTVIASSTPVATATPTEGHVDTTLIESYACRSDSLNGCLISDKADYAPTDVALITGYGFLPNTQYLLKITSSDQPEVNFQSLITSNEQGSFSYSYQLDGTYRPNYKVNLTDLSGVTLASTTFTDSPVSGCQNDSSGVNDETGQKDLTKMCVNYAGLPSTLNLIWNWDETSWSGANTGDACSLFDTNSNGKADFAICVGVNGNPASLSYTRRYSCTDTKAQNCTGPTLLSIVNGTTCATTLQNTDPFAGGMSYPQDTVATCTVGMNDVGRSSSTLIDVCSYPSGSPSSSPSDCIVYKDHSGKLTITKVLTPSDDPGLFNLQIDGTNQATDIGNGGTTLTSSLSTNNHTFGETAGSSTSLSNYTASVVCKDSHGTGNIVSTTGTNPWTISIAEDKDYLCTITNSRKNNGSITIIKDAVPNNSQDFSFTTGSGLSSFSLDDDSNSTLSNTKVFSNLAAGTYSVSESATTGWDQTSATCTDGSPVSAISLQSGENVTCTFTNTLQKATLTLVKSVTNNNGGSALNTAWTLTATGPTTIFGVSGSSAITNAQVTDGTYTLSESGGPTGYTASSWTCTNSVTVTNGQITLTPGKITTCTITNDDQQATLTVVKQLNQQYGGNLSCSDFSFKVDGGSSTPFESDCSNNISIDAGNHSILEVAKSGYTPSYLNCTNIVLSSGGNATCTITNDDQPATLIVTKVVINDNGGNKVAQDFTFKVNNTGSNIQFVGTGSAGQVTLTLNNGTYSILENSDSQYSTTYDNCSNLIIGNGETQTCTITNDDIQPKLTVTKVVINDNGGTKEVSDFPLFVDSTFLTSGVQVGINAGNHTISETNQSGYVGTISGDCARDGSITLVPGDVKACTITNNDTPAHLIVIKHVITDNGGIAEASNFTTTISSVTTANPTAAGSETGVDNLLTTVGSYSVDEGNHTGYSKTLSTDCSGTIALGETKTCTITNDDIAPTLTLVKQMDIKFSGTAQPSDWTLDADNGDGEQFSGQGPTVGPISVLANSSYTLTELNGPTGYSASSWVCDGGKQSDNTVTIGLAQNVTCTITNSDIQPKLTVIKDVNNNHGGTKQPSDFPLFVNDTSVTTDVQNLFNVGSYTISETSDPGYASSFSGDCSENGSISLASGDVKSCTITNDDKPATLIIKKVIVDAQNGTKTYSDFSFQINQDEPMAFEADGQNDLTVNAGTYSVTEPAVSGYTTTYDNCSELQLANGGTATCTITNTLQGQVTVYKFNDLNADGIHQVSEPYLSNWNIFANPSIGATIASQTTNSEGNTTFNLNPGNYVLSETQQEGWYNSSIYCLNVETRETGSNITINSGDQKTCYIGNYQMATITVYKDVVDSKGNNISDNTEFAISAGSIGDTTFSENSPAIYHVMPGFTYTLYEKGNTGKYSLTSITGDEDTELSGAQITVSSGQEKSITFVNQKINKPTLKISKTNNRWPNDVSTGSEVQYTLTLTVQDGDIFDAKVVDLPPFGIKYKSGSYSATQNGVNFPVAEPIYSSPGKWILGNLAIGDTVVLNYLATVDSSATPGVYKDLAYAFGCANDSETDCTTSSSDKVLALADIGKLSDNYVGTQVSILANASNKDVNVIREEKVTGEVLGATTSLPATGSNNLWLILSFAFSLLGLSLLLIRKKMLNIFAILVFAIALITPANSFAEESGNIFLRLEEPKSPTILSQFPLDFTSMDQLNRALTVKCYVIKPDNSTVQLGSDIAVKAGGNSGQCTMNSFSLSEDNKTYKFYAVVSVDSESFTSDQIAVLYDGSKPETPTYFGKEKITDCQYKIKFKAANDGQTVQIKIYRADTTSFIADSGSLIGEIGISPNTEGSYISNIPENCSKEYYYAIRAFDTNGNASDVVGDTKTITTTSSSTTSTGIVLGSQTNVAIPVKSANLGKENNQGENAQPALEPKTTTSPTETSGAVLGQQTVVQKITNTLGKLLIPALFVVGILLLGYGFKKRKDQN